MSKKFYLALITTCLLLITGCGSKGNSNSSFSISKEDNKTIELYINENLIKPNSGGKILSAHEVLGSDKEAGEIYVWTIVQEFINKGDGFEKTSGLSQPLVLKVEETDGSLKIFNHKAPRDGNDYPNDIKNLFPKEVRNKIANFNNQKLIEELDDKYLDNSSKN